MSSTPPLIFDRAARRLRRDRCARTVQSPLDAGIAEDLAERLDAITHEFRSVLVINTGAGKIADVLRARGMTVVETDYGPAYAARRGARLCDEDRLSLEGQVFDLVVMPGGLDTIDDVPGALLAARRVLAPEGLFMAWLVGGPSLPILRDAIRTADAADGRAVARFHPQIDVRGAGDLLVRTGYTLPVADATILPLAYAGLDRLIADIRNTGLSNVLATRTGADRAWLSRVRTAFEAAQGDDGRTIETVTMLTLTGWQAGA